MTMTPDATATITADLLMWVVGGGALSVIALLNLYHGSVLRRLDERSEHEEKAREELQGEIRELRELIEQYRRENGERIGKTEERVVNEANYIKKNFRSADTCDLIHSKL